MRIACCLLLSACWPTPAPAPESIGNAAPAPTAIPRSQLAEREALPARTIWRGKYECAQGWTGLQLTIETDRGGAATAIFDFGPLPDNPNVPPGSYRMTGTASEVGASFQVRLVPDTWILQPPGYMMVGLEAATERTRTYLRGTITDPACGTVDLERVK